MAALQKVGEGIISGFRGGRPAIRKLETRPGARYSVRGKEGGELKQRDAGVRRRGGKKRFGGSESGSREFKVLRIRHEQIRRKRS